MSDKTDIKLFELLKKEVSKVLRKTYPANHEDISKWKGQEIKFFQEDLIEKVQSRISEKWFYTHLKSESNDLPRVDILNLLSSYCGYKDWYDFKIKHRKTVKRKSKLKLYLPLFLLIIPLFWFAFSNRYYDYHIQIVDAVTLQPINEEKLEVIWLKKDESPKHFHHLEDAALLLESEKQEITLVIKAPYYQLDTVKRKLPYKNYSEIISLQPDDFSLMVHFFSSSDVDKWKEYRNRLDDLIAFNATIFQVDDEGKGMEMYNKQEFIDKLSFPLSKLKNIEVLETRVSKGKIVFLRFKLPKNEK